ncbi:MAG TPA: DMT family transporter [Steroidobacteraceae bacterium]|jgi:drug/metabolite transporter (DMT)-like permease|nr:DMT family transporter [Steroidobacteraceae bacterium]
MSKRGWILFLSLGLLWGMPYLLIRIAVGEIDPLVVAGTRTLMGALLLLPVALHRNALAPAFRKWKWLLAFTLIEMSVPWVLLGHAETRLNSSTAGLLIAVVPLFAALIVTKLGHERLEPRRLFGLGLGFAGVALLIGLDIDFSDFLAVGATIVVSLCYAIGPIIIDRKLNDVPAIGVIVASLILATLIYAPFAPFLWPEHFSAKAAWSVVGLGVLCTAGAFLVFFALIAEVGPARATVITYVNPAVAMVLGALVLDEPLTLGMAIGFPLVILGSYLGTMRGRNVGHGKPVTES